MSKKPSLLIIVLILLYLAGLLYLTLRKPSENEVVQEPTVSQQIAPDGTVLNGPKSPPISDNPIDKNTSPLQQSTGPTYPPPQ